VRAQLRFAAWILVPLLPGCTDSPKPPDALPAPDYVAGSVDRGAPVWIDDEITLVTGTEETKP